MEKWLVIADDFTGANDTGVQLAKRGIETHVVLQGRDINQANLSYVLDTESRNISEQEAYERISYHLKEVLKNDYKILYKKVDSTLRGNITSEIKAVDDVYGPQLIIFAPAFPMIGRTTVGGIHYVNGKRIIETEFSKDPLKPVTEDRITNLLETGFEEKISHHYLDQIRNNKIDLSRSRIHTFDGEKNQDLENIIQAAFNSNKKILWVGSAGLANSILSITRPFKPSLALIGSVSEVSRKQMNFAKSKGTQILEVSIAKALKNRDITNYVTKGIEIIKAGSDLIVTSSYDKNDYLETLKTAQGLSIEKEELGHLVQKILGDISKEIIKVSHISGLFVTGGDTAIGFIHSTNAVGSRIIEEVTTGIPFIQLKGGDFNGLKMITKAGAFGNEDAIYNAMEKLKEDKQ